jgi:hypothetical protein
VIRFRPMSICVAFNLSDGVVIAVDSATTMFDGEGNISKVFPDVDKLFQLGNLKIGIATYGIAAMKGRTIGSFIREFAENQDNVAILSELSVAEIVERLRVFFLGHYQSFSEEMYGTPFAEIPSNLKGNLGLVVGGFSRSSFLSEIWEIVVPIHSEPNSSRLVCGPGNYTFAWFASSVPINRYIKGIDPALSVALRTKIEALLERGLTEAELGEFGEIIGKAEYPIQTNGMPIQSGIACARFLVDFVLGHYRFAETHPIVGGKARIGTVTYSQNAFKILD